LKVCNAEELADKSATSDDADNSKPDPDIVLAALKQIGLEAEEVILLGDTPYDVERGTGRPEGRSRSMRRMGR